MTDNAATNDEKCMNSFERLLSPSHCYGCISHGLNLLFTEFLKLITLNVPMSQATDIVKEIKNSYLSGAAFRDI